MSTKKTTSELFDSIYSNCGYINWRADEIKQAQVEIETAAREIQASLGTTPPVDPPVDPGEPPDEITPPPDGGGSGGDPTQAVKIGPEHLHYIGAFRVPQGIPPGCQNGFDYALTCLAYNSQNHSLFLNNHAHEQKTAEITIPTPSGDMNRLATASYIQTPVDITEGKLQCLLAGGAAYYDRCEMGDLLVYGGKLMGTAYIFYDGSKKAVLSHFYSNKLVSEAGDMFGFYDVWNGGRPGEAGFVGGWLCHVPPEWQDLLGGTALTGNGCLSIISRTSFGPSAFVFTPENLVGATTTVPATPLVYYPEEHPTLGAWGQEEQINLVFNQATQIRGIVFPTGSRTVLFFGLQGLGYPCYGFSDLTSPKPPGEGLYNGHCYDPARPDKGCHAYPYQAWVWAYDANDLLAVKNGQRQPWDVVPYNVWGLELPIPTPDGALTGVAYDPLHQRLYVGQHNASYLYPGASSPYDRTPIIHVYDLREPVSGKRGGLLHI
jgi:hypothetical protein